MGDWDSTNQKDVSTLKAVPSETLYKTKDQNVSTESVLGKRKLSSTLSNNNKNYDEEEEEGPDEKYDVPQREVDMVANSNTMKDNEFDEQKQNMINGDGAHNQQQP